MNDYQKYPVHKSIEITDFLQFPSPEFIAGDVHKVDNWECLIAVEKIGNSSVNICIHLSKSDEIKRVRVRYFLGMFNETGKALKSWEGRKAGDTDGFLVIKPWTVPQPDKSFTFKFGLHVSSIMGIDNIWKFNFYDALFNAENNSKMIVYKDENNQKVLFYTHKKLIMFHSTELPPLYRREVDITCNIRPRIITNMLEKCLQIAHGVQVHCSFDDLNKIPPIAKMLGLKNVTNYCERGHIEFLNQVEVTDKVFHLTFIRDRRHLLVHLLKTLKSNKELKKILETMDIQKMNSESMKRCAHFFFHNC